MSGNLTKGRRSDAELAANLGISEEEYRARRIVNKINRLAKLHNHRLGEAQDIVDACDCALKGQITPTREALLKNTIDNSAELVLLCKAFASKLNERQFDLEVALDFVEKKYNALQENK